MKRFILLSFCVLGALVVNGVGLDASTYKSGEIVTECSYSCTQDVSYVVAPVFFDHIVKYMNAEWTAVGNSVYIKAFLKQNTAYAAINDRVVGSLPEGCLKPPETAKKINSFSPVIKRSNKVLTGGSGGMQGTYGSLS